MSAHTRVSSEIKLLEKKLNIKIKTNCYKLDNDGEITNLDLRSNKITDIKPLAKLEKITDLDLRSNKITDIEPLAKLEKITNLYLSSNQITDISSLAKLEKLTTLYLYNNQITDIKPLAKLEKITNLYLFSNQITDIKPLAKLEKITNLYLFSNQITDIKPLAKLENITTLDLANNQITDIEPLTKLEKITTLNLDNNKITDIKPLAKLEKITTLSLRNNQITKVPKFLFELNTDFTLENKPSYNTISLYNNPILTPPVDVLMQGKDAVLEYFKEIEKYGSQAINEARVILLGSGSAGKTSLLNRLHKDEFNYDEKQTHGINMQDIDIKQGNEEMSLHFWDFGGQEIQHSLHQFFFTNRCFYWILLDVSRQPDLERYEKLNLEDELIYWLNYVTQLGKDSPVWVVYSKIDKNPDYTKVDENKFRTKYPNIKDFFAISNYTKMGLENFKTNLKDVIFNLDGVKSRFGNNDIDIRQEVTNRTKHPVSIQRKNYISYDDFIDICINKNVKKETAQEFILNRLNTNGDICYYQSVQDKLILDPEWLIHASYKIVSSNEVKRHLGVLEISDIKRLIQDDKKKALFYNNKDYITILNIMKEFSLCYFEEPMCEILIPSGFKSSSKKPFSEATKECKVYFFKFKNSLPSSIIIKFIASCIPNAVDGDYWNSGIYIKHPHYQNTKAYIIQDKPNHRIMAYIKGDNIKELWAIIMERMQKASGVFGNEVFVMLKEDANNKEISMSYNDLVKLYLKGVTNWIHPNLDDEVNIIEILGDNFSISENKKKEALEKIEDISTSKEMTKEDILLAKELKNLISQSDTQESLFSKIAKTASKFNNIVKSGGIILTIIRGLFEQ